VFGGTPYEFKAKLLHFTSVFSYPYISTTIWKIMIGKIYQCCLPGIFDRCIG